MALFALLPIARAQTAQSTSPPPAPKAAHPPVVITSPEADYPPAARKALLSGQCIVSVLVEASGEPQDASIVRCSDPIFAAKSLAAVQKYRFQPARDEADKPIAVRLSVEIDFHLEDIANLPIANSSRFKYGVQPPDPR